MKSTPHKVFISYCHSDEKFKDELITHLSSLKRKKIIEEWHDRKLIPGQEWDKSIKQELKDADIIILLISADFLASNYCFDVEIQEAMKKHDQKEAVVIPIIIRLCDWQDLPFSKIQGLPKDAKPISTWEDRDAAYLDVINGIKNRIQLLVTREIKEENKLTLTDDNSKYLLFNHDTIIARLPRGYILIKDFEDRFYKISSWCVVAQYFDYDGNWKHATHYHESYHIRWDTSEGLDSQCHKLTIPRADWNYADSALYLVMELREREQEEIVEEIVQRSKGQDEYYDFYPANTKILKPTIPEKFIHLNKTGDIRDIIERISIDPWKNYELETLHEELESSRRQAYLLLYEKLDHQHPALKFVEGIVNEYNSTFKINELRKWGQKLSNALYDACQLIK